MAQPLGLQALRWTVDISLIGLFCVLQLLNLSVTSTQADQWNCRIEKEEDTLASNAITILPQNVSA